MFNLKIFKNPSASFCDDQILYCEYISFGD